MQTIQQGESMTHTLQINIADNLYEKFISFIQSLPQESISVKKLKHIYGTNRESFDYEPWSEDELLQIGKIGFDSKSFVDDGEDYSKW